jgi:hypothetical protein
VLDRYSSVATCVDSGPLPGACAPDPDAGTPPGGGWRGRRGACAPRACAPRAGAPRADAAGAGESGLGAISNCRLETDGVVGGSLTVSFDFPIDLAVPFLPSPPSWRTGTARASMRIEQLSAPPGPGGC